MVMERVGAKSETLEPERKQEMELQWGIKHPALQCSYKVS
jgi:hypothetical protein